MPLGWTAKNSVFFSGLGVNFIMSQVNNSPIKTPGKKEEFFKHL